MQKPQGGLGRGLGSLIPQKIAPPEGTEEAKIISAGLTEVSPMDIAENPHQPRTHFAETQLEDLISSIKEHGILQPLIVTKRADGKYELIAGERRLRASKKLGLQKVPVVIRTATDQQKLELALIENIQRHDLNAVEEAVAYQALMDQFSLRHDAVAERVGKSRSYVANTMRLLDLDDDVREALAQGKISRSHARTLLAEPNEDQRKKLFVQMLEGGMTVREAEARAGATTKQRTSSKKDPNLLAIEGELREVLGTKVEIEMKEGRGKMLIHFYSKEDLRELIKKMTG